VNLSIVLPGATAAEKFLELLHAFILKSRPAIVTTAGDVPVTTDIKFLARVWEAVRS
jgi:hypothetical protein